MKQLEDVLEEALNWELADLTLSSPKKRPEIFRKSRCAR